MAMKFNRALEVVEVHGPAIFHQATCSGSRIGMYTSIFVPSHNGKETENPVL